MKRLSVLKERLRSTRICGGGRRAGDETPRAAQLRILAAADIQPDPVLIAKGRKAFESGGTIFGSSHSSAAATIDESLVLPGGNAPLGHELIKLCGYAISETRSQKKETCGRAGDSGLSQRSEQRL